MAKPGLFQQAVMRKKRYLWTISAVQTFHPNSGTDLTGSYCSLSKFMTVKIHDDVKETEGRLMLSPKFDNAYPARSTDCEEAVTPSLTNILKNATLGGRSEEDADAVVEGTSVPGVRDLISEAVEAGWTAKEAVQAIKVVSERLQRGVVGRELRQ